VEVKAGKERKEGGCEGDEEGVIYLTRLTRRASSVYEAPPRFNGSAFGQERN
jgi:hypothetical protein